MIQRVSPGRHFHVTSSRNRASIAEHGLDWTRMGAARGIAGSHAPEQEGCFLCPNDHELEWFLAMNNSGGPVDVWAVEGIDPSELRVSAEGYAYVPRPIAPADLELVRQDVPAPPPPARADPSPTADRETLGPGEGLYFEL